MRPTNIRSAADAGQTGEATRTAESDMMHEYLNHLLNLFIGFSLRFLPRVEMTRSAIIGSAKYECIREWPEILGRKIVSGWRIGTGPKAPPLSKMR